VRVCHEHTAVFDDPNLVSCAGWPPVLTLADRAGLHEHLDRHLMLAGPGAANAAEKATSLVAGMVLGADSIDDMDVLRHGAMARLFGGVRAPSTLGTFLRSSPSAMSGSSTRSPPAPWLGWPPGHRFSPEPRRSLTSMSTTP